MDRVMHLLIPLAAAFVFALGSIFVKRAFAEGARVVQAFFLNCLLFGVAFQPFLLLSDRPIDASRLHLPIVVGTLFFVGHSFHFLAIRRGDVSVVAPILGSKVVFVALLSHLVFHAALGAAQWTAAWLTACGVFLMGRTDRKPGQPRGWATVLALLCALAFALCDALIQEWAGSFGLYNFLPMTFLVVGLEALLVLPFAGRSTFAWPKAARKWLLAAAVLTSVQGILVSASVGYFHDATGVNVVYGTRGLWSIALVWLVGRRLGNTERDEAGVWGLWQRVAGALAILGGVVVLWAEG